MKNENIPAEVKSKSLKETRKEIDDILNKIFLVNGINKTNPIKSVKNPGIIKRSAANAIDAPDISS